MSAAHASKVIVPGILVVATAALLRTLRGGPAPAFSGPPPRRGFVKAPTSSSTPGPAEPAEPAGRDLPTDGPGEGTATTAASAEHHPTASAPAPHDAADRSAWAPPVDGTCPTGYEIKAKGRSGIYHRPGMLAYERTIPDRCYPSAAAAEADGFRAAKR